MAKWEVRTGKDYTAFLSSMTKKMNTLAELTKTSCVQEIYECLKDVLLESVPLAPVEEGSLRESGHVSVSGVRYITGTVDGGTKELTSYDPGSVASIVDFEIGYTVEDGGTGREGDVNQYAIVQHEHVEFDHPNGGQAKFLEMPIRHHQPEWKKRVAERVQREVKGANE